MRHIPYAFFLTGAIAKRLISSIRTVLSNGKMFGIKNINNS
jgi:hypothetical protein